MTTTFRTTLSAKHFQSNSTSLKKQSKNTSLTSAFLATSDQIAFSKKPPKFSGRSLTAEKTKLGNLLLEKEKVDKEREKACDALKEVEQQVSDKRWQRESKIMDAGIAGLGTGVLGGAGGGAAVGAKAGAAIDLATGGLLIGFPTLIGTIGGGFAGMFLGGKTGDAVGEKVGKALTDDIPLKLLEEQRKHSRERDTLQASWKSLNDHYSVLSQEIQAADAVFTGVKDTHRIARTAIDITPFQDAHFHHLYNALKSDFDEVQDEGDNTSKTARKVPGFADRFKALTHWNLPSPGDVTKEVLNDLGSRDPQVQQLALRRLHFHDPRGQYKEQYAHVLREHPDHALAATALEMMTQYPELRPSNFNNELLKILGGQRLPLINTALDSLAILKPQDPRVDNALRQITHDTTRIPNRQIREKAVALLATRNLQNLTKSRNPQAVAERAMHGLLGNNAHKTKLSALIKSYYYALDDANHKGPSLKLYMPGEGGIGKSTLAYNLQKALFNNAEDMVVIRPDEIKANTDLADLLKRKSKMSTTGIHDLDNRVILFDEFGGVDSIEPASARRKFLEDMKKLFAVNSGDIEAAQTWLRSNSIQMKNPILVMATNKDLPVLDIADESSRFYAEYNALESRMEEMLIKGSVHRFDLLADLTPHLPEFVADFGKQRYFETVENRKFDGPIHLTPAAKQLLTAQLKERADQPNLRTQERKGITGRSSAEVMVNKINEAIERSEEGSSKPFLRNGALGKIKESLVIDCNWQGVLTARSGSL